MMSDISLVEEKSTIADRPLETVTAVDRYPVPSTFSWQKQHNDFVLIAHYDAQVANLSENNIGETAKVLFRESPEILANLTSCYQTKRPFKIEGYYDLCCTDQKRDLLITYIFTPPDIVTMCAEDVTLHKQSHKILRSTRNQLVIDARTRTSELLKINRMMTKEIVQHKISLDELRRQTQRNETLLRKSPDGFWLIDLKGQLCEVNESYCKMSGYSTKELLSMNVNEIDAIEKVHDTQARINKIIKTGSDLFETQHRRKNGSSFDVEVSVSLVTLTNKQYFFAFLRDITQRKTIESALLANEIKMRLITDNLPVLISYVDKHMRFRFNNKAYKDWFNLETEELDNKLIKDVLGKELYHQTVGYYEKALLGTCIHHEMKSLFPDGKTRCVDITHIPDFDENQNVKGIVTLVNDISNRKRLEEETRKHQQNLAHVSRISTVNELTSGLAHEINQPLTAISNYCKAGLHWINNGNTEPMEYQNLLNKINAQSERASNVIHHIRELITNKKIQRTSTNINKLVENSIELLEHDLRQFDVNITSKLERDLPFVKVDNIQIQQVMLNLLKNSIEAMSKTNTNKPKKLFISTKNLDTNSIEVTVRDNGPGLPQDDFEQIFKSFFTTKLNGLGLGLAVSRTLIEAHGGKLWAEANTPNGSQFHFTLMKDNIG